MRHATLFALLASTACATTTATGPAPGHAPRPFTADEIRDATPAGTTWTYEMRQLRQPPVKQVTKVVRSDDVGATFEVVTYNEGGEAMGGTKTSTATWAELESHATFPAAHTKIYETEVETRAGTFDALRYEVAEPGDVVRIKNFYFAKTRPGAPVLYEQTDDGQVMFRMELVKEGE